MSLELPPGWALTNVGTLGRYINGRGFGKSEWRTKGLPIIRIQNLNDEEASFNYSDEEHEPKYRVNDGDLLVAWAASLGVYIWKRGPAWLNQHIFRVEVEKRLVSKSFLYYALKHAITDIFKKTHGSGMVHVTKDRFESHPIKLPPLKEQGRIVSKIEELFSRIDEGERALQRVQKLTERYRQSVLKAAVTGELTREWRERHKGKLESGEALLQRILKARREAWEKAELKKMKAKGQKLENDDWKKKYPEPLLPDTDELPDLPEGWMWASLDMLADIVGGVTVDKKRSTASCAPVPYLRVANVQRGFLDLSEVKKIFVPKETVKELRLQHGDVLFNEGGDLDKLGRGWIWEEQLPVCIHQNHVFRARLFIPGSWNKIVSWYANVLGRQLFMQLGKQTTNLASLSLAKLKRFPVPIMDGTEAKEIVSRADDALSVIDKHVGEIARQLAATGSLRQAVLMAAFSGELVAQDPSDEPASMLLQRSMAACEMSESLKNDRSSRKKAIA